MSMNRILVLSAEDRYNSYRVVCVEDSGATHYKKWYHLEMASKSEVDALGNLIWNKVLIFENDERFPSFASTKEQLAVALSGILSAELCKTSQQT